MVGDPREPGRGDENYRLAPFCPDIELRGDQVAGAVFFIGTPKGRTLVSSSKLRRGRKSAVFEAAVTVITYLGKPNDFKKLLSVARSIKPRVGHERVATSKE